MFVLPHITPRKALSVAVAATAAFSYSNAVVVDTIHSSATGLAEDWFESGVNGAGTVSIADLTGQGGNLENNQPAPNGAVKFTTTANPNDKAEIATQIDLGLASSVLKSIDLSYSFFKAGLGLDAAAAPAIKLVISNPGGTGDNYGQLIFEPYWNIGTPPGGVTDEWVKVNIDENTGSGGDATGGWWWTKGFEISPDPAGPPLRSLSEWADAFALSDPADFADARVLGIAVGIGTYNEGQVNYFDDLSIDTGSVETFYDFEAKSAVPDNGSLLALLSLTLTGLVGFRRFSKTK